MEYFSIFKTQNSPNELLIYGKVIKKLPPSIRTKNNGETFTSYPCCIFVSNAAEWCKMHMSNFVPQSESKHLTFLMYAPEFAYNNLNQGDSILIIGGLKMFTHNDKIGYSIEMKQYRTNNLYENNNIVNETNNIVNKTSNIIDKTNNLENIFKEEFVTKNDSPFNSNTQNTTSISEGEIENSNRQQHITNVRNSRGRKRETSFNNVIVTQ